MNTSQSRGMRPFAGNAGRYTAVDGPGKRVWIRDQVTLRADIIELLSREGAMPKKRIITTLGAAQAAIEAALASLLADQLIETYKARSTRGRMDNHWCIFGQSTARPTSFRFPAAMTLAAMQSHAKLNHGALK